MTGRTSLFVALGLAICLSLTASISRAQSFPGVLTYHNDNFRTGANLQETILTPANVNASTFGKIYSWPVDGYVYAQPLYVPGVLIKRHSRNVVIIATEHDSVYAFNADSKARKPLWKTSFLSRKLDITTVPYRLVNSTDIVPEIGITSTPVIDPALQTVFVVAKTLEQGTNFVLRLHALNITNGKERPGSPVVLTATVAGDGDGSSPNGTVSYDPVTSNQRAALTLVNGVVYIANASHGDNPPYHGWVLGYEEGSLQQVSVFNATPNGSDGGIWMSGGGLAADSDGNLYFSTGNGTFDASSGGVDYGDSFLKLSTSGNAPAVTGYFTPWNQDELNEGDLDLGSGGMLLLPDQLTGVSHVALSASKQGEIYVVNRDALGGYNAASDDNDQIVQDITTDESGSIFCTPAYWNGWIYFGGVNVPITQYSISGGLLSPDPVYSETVRPFGFPGATPAISADGASNAILWAIDNESFASRYGHAVLYAFDANNISNELYDSNQSNTRDWPGPAVKFTVPTIANGKVYIGGQSRVTVYGLLKKRR